MTIIQEELDRAGLEAEKVQPLNRLLRANIRSAQIRIAFCALIVATIAVIVAIVKC